MNEARCKNCGQPEGGHYPMNLLCPLRLSPGTSYEPEGGVHEEPTPELRAIHREARRIAQELEALRCNEVT